MQFAIRHDPSSTDEPVPQSQPSISTEYSQLNSSQEVLESIDNALGFLLPIRLKRSGCLDQRY